MNNDTEALELESLVSGPVAKPKATVRHDVDE
ncbi:UNVERIFIED_ORG: hypothetical protein GGI57_006471 [Rhizobium aethiopicum]|jgi:hypothetical protein|uniref:Uncharacterized protein n=2 Tax=Rhizobium TaxID=379 RepID=A0A7W6YCH5_RHIET|nr:hypothetical protein [Rhizobium aethiopicum]MBB4300882.1 hypothetical protein [Rhizobium leguminosarum]MBB4436577.1 hypothetical protein [Rhizobium esperanzae]MBB4482967.1 hypothetical protein [Rhizobium etli]MBB4421275.1 hypothetical protein [Rhizobium leguminosarum]